MLKLLHKLHPHKQIAEVAPVQCIMALSKKKLVLISLISLFICIINLSTWCKFFKGATAHTR